MASYTLPTNAVWLITGCSSGIGLQLCSHLATHTTSRIVATARNPSALAPLPDTPNVLKLALDVTSEDSIQSALAQTLSKFGRIDVVVNNAGYGMHADTETIPLDKARALMDANYWGAVRITQLVLPILRDKNPSTGPHGGLILQMSSLGGRMGFPGGAFYHGSKFALEGFTEALAKEMPDEWNIHFAIIEPGGVKTNYTTTANAAAHAEAEERHPAYTDPGMPTNQLREYTSKPEAMRNWAEPEKVVEVLYEFVKRGGKLPLRLPLGSDSWGMQRKGAQAWLDELEKVKEISTSTSTGEQLRSIDFLKV